MGRKAGFIKDLQYYKFCAYGFLKNLRFFEAFLILFFLEKDLSYLQIGIVYSIREITRNVLEIPAGIVADILGRRRTLIASFAFYIASFLLYSVSASMLLIIAATIIFGLGDAFRTGTHKAMIFDYLQEKGWSDQKVHYYGHTRSWSQAGSALSALAAAVLVIYSGNYLNIFLYSTIPYLLGLLLIISYPAWLDGRSKPLRFGELGKASLNTLKEFWHSFRSPGVLRGILNVSSYSGYYRAVKDYLQPVILSLALALPVLQGVDEKRKSALLIGLLYFIIYLLSSAVTRRAGRFSQRFNRLSTPLNLTLVLGFLAGILSGLFYTADLLVLSVLFFILVYMVENLRMPAGISWFAGTVNQSVLATALSVESQGKSLFAALIALGMGFFADLVGPGYALLICSAGMLVLMPVLGLKGD